MTEGLFHVYLILMAIITANQPSGKDGIHPEERKEVVQRMKEREVMLHQQQLRLEKEIAELEARQESLAWPLWELKRRIQWHTCTGFCLVFSALFVVWNKHRNEARWQHGEEEAVPGLWGEAWKGVAFLLTKLLGLFRAIIMGGPIGYLLLLVGRVVELFRAICITIGGTVGYLVDGIAELPLRLLRSHQRNLDLEIP